MGLPVLKKCCGCVSLESGCIILAVVAICGAVINIIFASWNLPQHKTRAPEDNLLAMMTIMFSTLSIIFNIVLLIGVHKDRPGYLQITILFNALFIVFSFMLLIAKCLFSPEYENKCFSLSFVALGSILLTISTIFCIYYFVIINSLYIKMKLQGPTNSAIPI